MCSSITKYIRKFDVSLFEKFSQTGRIEVEKFYLYRRPTQKMPECDQIWNGLFQIDIILHAREKMCCFSFVSGVGMSGHSPKKISQVGIY